MTGNSWTIRYFPALVLLDLILNTGIGLGVI